MAEGGAKRIDPCPRTETTIVIVIVQIVLIEVHLTIVRIEIRTRHQTVFLTKSVRLNIAVATVIPRIGLLI